MKKITDGYMTRKEAMKYLDICHKTMWTWCKTGKLTPHKKGLKYFFKKSELDKVLD